MEAFEHGLHNILQEPDLGLGNIVISVAIHRYW